MIKKTIRKVIQIADSTLTISLPKDWRDLHNIKKGDSLCFFNIDDILILSNKAIDETRFKLLLYLKLKKIINDMPTDEVLENFVFLKNEKKD